MSKIPKVGLHIIALLILTGIASFGARLASHWRMARQEMVPIPDHFDVDKFRWVGVDCPPPVGDGERDHPPALNRVYQLGTQAPVFVSIARINTLNGLRSPSSYLLDPDGRLFGAEVQMIRPMGENHVHYAMEIAQGHDNTIMLVHWVQAPNQSAYSDYTQIPKSVAKSMLLHSTLYSCDVWVPLRTDSNGAFIRKTLMRFANGIEGQIATGHLPADTTIVLPAPGEINREVNPTNTTVPSPSISPIPAPGVPAPLSPTPPGSSPGGFGGTTPFPSGDAIPAGGL
ncbi:MAG: hypothetical protein JWL77_1168 [Chthonomonadaceae bacterium]|nr:hypothetical protein [Chthonomonadaceae bacterium]